MFSQSQIQKNFVFSPEFYNTRMIYSVTKMRQRLIECLEKGKMSQFPKEKTKKKKKKKNKKKKKYLQNCKNSGLVPLQKAWMRRKYYLMWESLVQGMVPQNIRLGSNEKKNQKELPGKYHNLL